MREPKLYVACGAKEMGKTYTSTKVIEQYCKGNGSIPGRKVIILDVNNEYPYRTLSWSDVPAFGRQTRPEIRRATVFRDNGKKMGLNEIADHLHKILDTFRNGMIVVEDTSKYISDSLPADIIGDLCTIRHVGVDVLMHFQLIGKAGHPKIMGTINHLRLHRTTDTVTRNLNKFTEASDILMIGEKIVKTDYDKAMIEGRGAKGLLGNWNPTKSTYHSAYVYVDFDEYKLRGKFSKEHFTNAVSEYIDENENSILRPLLARKNNDGVPLFTRGGAVETIKKNFYLKFYGNPDKS